MPKRKTCRWLRRMTGLAAALMLLAGCGDQTGSRSMAPEGTSSAPPAASAPVPTQPQRREPEMTIELEKPGEEAYDSVLEAAIVQAGSKETLLYARPGVYQLEEDHNIPANIQIQLQKGACFSIAEGKKLSITGTVIADADYIFRGLGTVNGPIQGEGYVQWFGADEEREDHTDIFQKALDACAVVLVPDRAEGYKIRSLTFSKPVVFKGIGTNRVNLHVLESPQNSYLIVQSSDVTIQNVTVKCILNLKQNNKMGIYLNTSKGSYENIHIENVNIDDPGFGVGDSNSKTGTVKNLVMEKVNINSNRNTGVHFTNMTTGIKLRDVCVSSFGPDIPSKGYIFENVQDMFLENVDVLGGFTKKDSSGDGMTFIDCENVRSYRLMIDYVNGRQLVMKNCKNFHLSNFVTSLLKLEGIYMENVTDSTLDVIKANGIYNETTPAMVMKQCSNVTFNDLIVQISMQDGLIMEGCTNNTFNNLVICETAGAALKQTGGSGNVINGLASRQNGGGITWEGDGNVINGYVDAKGKATAIVNSPYAD